MIDLLTLTGPIDFEIFSTILRVTRPNKTLKNASLVDCRTFIRLHRQDSTRFSLLSDITVIHHKPY